MSYYDPIPYVLPDEDEILEDSFGEEDDDIPEILIQRRTFSEYNCRCIFFYCLRSGDNEYDLAIWGDELHGLVWSVEEDSFRCVGLDEIRLLKWMLQVAEQVLANFEFYWNSAPHEWNIPPAPRGWKVVIR